MGQQIAIYDQGCEFMVSVPLLFPNKWNNLSRQSAGQGILLSGRRVFDVKL